MRKVYAPVCARTRVTHNAACCQEEGTKKVEKISERQIERRFVNAVRERGGVALKFVSPGRVGVPDRIVLLPGGRCVFAEMKALSGRLRRSQKAVKVEIESYGFDYSVITSYEEVKAFCERYFGKGVHAASVSALRD